MSVAAQRQLRSAIEDRRFSPVYYLHGDDDYRKDEAVAQLIASAVDPSTREFNFEQFRGADATSDALDVALSSLPMLADRRVVVIRDVGGLKKGPRAVLDRYLQTPAPETVLALVSPAGAKPDEALERRAVAVGFPTLDGDRITTWLRQHADKLGLTLSPDALPLLAEAIEGDLAHGARELEKLASYTGSRVASASDVEAIVGIRRGESVADLLDAIAERNAPRAVALVPAVLAQPKTSGVSVVINLGVQILAMAWARAERDRGMNAQRLESELFRLMKEGAAFPGRPWGDAVKCWARNLPRWPAADLRRALDHVLAADLALKDSRLSSDEGVLHSLVLMICQQSHEHFSK